jgi:3-hydroxy-3-methylglutaryl CoA synthase
MAGIVSYGAYIPRYRINRNTIFNAMGFLMNFPTPGEKAVANWDEDSISMATDAGIDCLRGTDRNKVDGVYFASTTQPYMVRQNSAIISSALDLKSDARTNDFVASTKAGTSALLSAIDALKGGAANNILVCAADCRTGKPGGPQEHQFGDGAAALLVGNDNVIATFEGSHSVSYDFPDRWKATGEKFEHAWEDRFIRDEGYNKIIFEAIAGLAKKCNVAIKDIAKIAYCYPYPREHASIAKKLGAEPTQVQDNLLDKVGETGAAYALMMLVAALEDAKPGDKIMVVSFGNGSDAMLFTVTDNIKKIKGKMGVKGNLANRKELTSYEKYAAFHNAIPIDIGMRGETIPYTALSLYWRDIKEIAALHGSKCKKCGTPQYPANRICVNPKCRAIDEMEPYRFSDKKAAVFNYTGDNLAASISPPAIYGMVDFEGGGRAWLDFTDCDLEEVKVGLPVELTFRRKYVDEARGIHGYFWKVVPVRS